MLKTQLIRVSVFVLTLLAGLGTNYLLSSEHRCARYHDVRAEIITTPLRIDSVPDADYFSPAIKRSGGFEALVRLQALFKADGTIADIKTAPIVPYGASEDFDYGRMGKATPFMLDSKFVRQLPYGMTEAAIDRVQRVRFSPKKVNGRAVSERVTILVDFSYHGPRWSHSRWSHGCDSIVTLMDDNGVLWPGNTWTYRQLCTFNGREHRQT